MTKKLTQRSKYLYSDNLQSIIEQVKELGLEPKQVELRLEYSDEWSDEKSIHLSYSELETDEEYTKRIAREAEQQSRQAEDEKLQYERLRKKFESK